MLIHTADGPNVIAVGERNHREPLISEDPNCDNEEADDDDGHAVFNSRNNPAGRYRR